MGDEIEFNPYYGVFPYHDFVKSEGIPVIEEYAVDCHTVPLEPWERLGGLGAYVHLAGRSDYLSAYVVEIPPGGQLNPEQHMHDELIHVISGRGATVIEDQLKVGVPVGLEAALPLWRKRRACRRREQARTARAVGEELA